MADRDNAGDLDVLSLAHLRDVVSRTCSVMEVQKDDNGEPFAEGNDELYRELRAIVAACDRLAGKV